MPPRVIKKYNPEDFLQDDMAIQNYNKVLKIFSEIENNTKSDTDYYANDHNSILKQIRREHNYYITLIYGRTPKNDYDKLIDLMKYTIKLYDNRSAHTLDEKRADKLINENKQKILDISKNRTNEPHMPVYKFNNENYMANEDKMKANAEAKAKANADKMTAKEEAKKVTRRLDDAQSGMHDAQSDMDDAQSDMDDAKRAIADAQRSMDTITQTLKLLEDRKKKLEGDRNTVRKRVFGFSKEKNSVKIQSELNTVLKSISTQEYNEKREKDNMQDAENKMQEAQIKMEKAEKKMEEAENEMQEEAKKMQEEAKKMQEEANSVKQKMSGGKKVKKTRKVGMALNHFVLKMTGKKVKRRKTKRRN